MFKWTGIPGPKTQNYLSGPEFPDPHLKSLYADRNSRTQNSKILKRPGFPDPKLQKIYLKKTAKRVWWLVVPTRIWSGSLTCGILQLNRAHFLFLRAANESKARNRQPKPKGKNLYVPVPYLYRTVPVCTCTVPYLYRTCTVPVCTCTVPYLYVPVPYLHRTYGSTGQDCDF